MIELRHPSFRETVRCVQWILGTVFHAMLWTHAWLSKNSERVGCNCAQNNHKLLIIIGLAERVGFESATLLETTELSGAIWSSKVLQGNERNR